MPNAFDGVTGVELDESLLSKMQEQTETSVKEALALSAMQKTPGWKHLEDYINDQIRQNHHKLLEAQSFGEVRRLQERVKALADVLTYVETRILEGERQHLELQEFETGPLDQPDTADNPEETKGQS